MAIETYMIEDADKLIAEPEQLEEWTKTVNELGLDGQISLMKQDKSPIPFAKMNETEERVYKTLCPQRTAVKSYNNGTIPLRVLSLIALSEREHYFPYIEIWDDHASPDPIAVGKSSDNYNADLYLIARWGDELRSFVELKQIAMQRWIEEKKTDLKDKISEAQNNLANIETKAEKYFQGNWVNI